MLVLYECMSVPDFLPVGYLERWFEFYMFNSVVKIVDAFLAS